MKIAFESSALFLPVAELLTMLTNMAEICTDNVQYDAANGIVEILMERRETIRQGKKGCLGAVWLRPFYIAGQTRIASVLTIRQVTEMKMDVDEILVTECNSCFSVIMGVKMEGNELYIGSLEEAKGKILCEIHIKVEGINIELADQG